MQCPRLLPVAVVAAPVHAGLYMLGALGSRGLCSAPLAAEILAVTGKDPGLHYQALEAELGGSFYARQDAPANAKQKSILGNLSPELVKAEMLAGEPIVEKLTAATCNKAPIGGLKVVTENGWFAARPSGTEDIYKIYAESLKSAAHLAQIQQEAREIVDAALGE